VIVETFIIALQTLTGVKGKGRAAGGGLKFVLLFLTGMGRYKMIGECGSAKMGNLFFSFVQFVGNLFK